jgi:nucleotide-binding universal stress UspA family protein
MAGDERIVTTIKRNRGKMYKTILLTLDTSPTDRAIIAHVKSLAKVLGSTVTLLHVATGVPAQFHGANAAGEEIDEDRAYLSRVKAEFEAEAIPVHAELAFGDPVTEIVKWVNDKGCELVAMGTHGHRLVADLILGTTASRVQHSLRVPVLLLRAH